MVKIYIYLGLRSNIGNVNSLVTLLKTVVHLKLEALGVF